MLELVTIDDARQQLRLDEPDSDGGADDAWLAIAIPAISEAVRLWVKQDWRLYLPERDTDGAIVTDTNGDPIPSEDSNGPIVHPTVRLAVLIELASQSRFREGEGQDNTVTPDAGYGYVLNKVSTNLLGPLRKSTVR